ncbi:MAG: type II secretion system F family protein [Candidatus Aenigmarchaeota archaeon]|nr:type II secretion system F family protein [Candidatus Aenigmarchaeota archaeon]
MLGKIAYKLFGRVVESYAEYFDSLSLQLKQAKMKYPVEEYVSLLMLISLITFAAVLMAGSFYITITTARAFYSYTFSIIISCVAAVGVFFLGMYYPTMKAKGIQSEINKSIPFATIYMATVASSDTNAAQLFKIASLRGGHIGKECEKIYRDIHMLGMDVSTAITKAANRTPSAKFSELLWGMLSVIKRGGDLGEYLADKSKEYMNDYRRSLEDYSKQISFYTEIYITLIIVGTLFFIVLSSIMSPLVGGDILMVQTFLVFFFIPLISAGFLVLMKSLSPSN